MPPQHGSGRRRDEESRSGGQHKVAMRDPLAELGFLGCNLIEVHVEIVAGNTAKVHDICLCDGASVGQQRVADLQIIKITS